MDPGRLKYLVILQEPTGAVDALGQPTGAYADVSTVRADIRVISGMESVRAGAVSSVGLASVRIRARAGVNAGMRFLHGAIAYEIQAVPPVCNDPRYLDLPCKVVNAAT